MRPKRGREAARLHDPAWTRDGPDTDAQCRIVLETAFAPRIIFHRLRELPTESSWRLRLLLDRMRSHEEI